MSRTLIIPIAAALALCACSKAEQQKTTEDVKSAAADVSDQAHQAANSPEAKQTGEEMKQAAKDAAHVTADALRGAAAGARQGAADVESKDQAGKDETKK